MRTIEEIMAALKAIQDGAEGRNFTDDEIRSVEELETELATVKRSAEVRKRIGAYDAPVDTGVRVAVVEDESDGFDLRNALLPSHLQTRAQETGTPSEGGYLVPEVFRNKIVEKLKAFGGVASQAETINTESGDDMRWVTNDDTSNLGEIVPEEAAAAGGADLVFGEATLGAYKYESTGAGGLPLKASWELLQDSAIDVESLVARKLAERIGRKQARDWVVGSGVGEPLGLITGKTGVEIAADTSGVTYGDLVTFVHSIDPAYRENAVWMMNDQSLAMLRKLTDSSDRPLWAPAGNGLAGSMPGGTLLGFPVIVDQAFPNFSAASNTTNWGVFGDIRQAYVIRRVKEVTLVVLRELYAINGQTGYMAWCRADGTVQDPNAYIALTGEA